MISVKEALKTISDILPGMGSETVAFNQCSNRVLAESIIAPFPQPRFDNSAMDGFAVISRDLTSAQRSSPKVLKLIGTSSAGNPYNGKLSSGDCIQCMTGAQIPEGADAIIIVENTSGFGYEEKVEFYRETVSGQHIRKCGEEIETGELLIEKGCQIGPAESGVLATFGLNKIRVMKKPKIALFVTGDELINPGNELDKGQIYNSNLPVLEDLISKTGGDLILKEVIPDKKSELELFLRKALDKCQVIVTSGGISMGKYDYIREVLFKFGVEEHFWKVAQKPGKPQFFGSTQDSVIFGLPGNPVSAFIGFLIFVYPAIFQMTGRKAVTGIKAVLDKPFPSETEKTRHLFGKVWFENNHLHCIPSEKTGSHMLTSSLGANCILTSNPGQSILPSGSLINLILLPGKLPYLKRPS